MVDICAFESVQARTRKPADLASELYRPGCLSIDREEVLESRKQGMSIECNRARW